MHRSGPTSMALALATCLALLSHATSLAQSVSPSAGSSADNHVSPVLDQALDDPTASGVPEWMRITTPGVRNNAILNAIAALPNAEMVVVGSEGEKALALRSDDGIAWERVAMPGPKRSDPVAVAAWHDGFVAVGSSFDRQGRFTGLVWTSPDGSTWSDSTQLKDAWLFDVDVTPGGLVLTGQLVPKPGRPGDPTIWTSSDALSWQPNEGPDVDLMGDLVVAPWGEWVLIGWDTSGDDAGEPSMWRSADGVSWTSVPLPEEATGMPAWITTSKFAVSDGRLLLGVTSSAMVTRNVSKDVSGGIWQLTDGMEWREAADSPLPVTSVVSGPSGGWAFTFPPTTLKSPDKFRQADALVLTSADGSTWGTSALDAFRGAMVTDAVRLPDDRVVAVGAGSPAFGPPLMWLYQPTAGE